MMRRFRVTDQVELERRQLPLFDAITDAVIRAAQDIAQHIKATVAPWWAAFRQRMTPKAKKQRQLVLELDELAQIPLIF